MVCKFILTLFGPEHNMYSRNLQLQGQFKLELYDLNKKLIKSSDWIDNFITNSGVVYPYSFAFADCFRFLSVGSGNAINSVNPSSPSIIPVTTGLEIPIPKFSYLGSRTELTGASSSAYSSCGFSENASGVTLFRQWTLPDNSGGFFTGSQTFKELMVSPGRPYVTGLFGVKFCSCDESDESAAGLDCSTVPQYYRWASNYYKTNNPSAKQKLKMCDADKAFARVVLDTPFNVVENSILNIAYQLNVSVDTGINFKTLTGPPYNPDPNWNSNLNFYGKICQMGVKLINDGTQSSKGPTNQKVLQHYDYTGYNSVGEEKYDFKHEYGESFIPPLGIGLEPSNTWLNSTNSNTSMYLSENNTEFLVSVTGGKLSDTGNYAPWNPSKPAISPINSGLMNFFNNNKEIISDTNYWTTHVNNYNIRIGGSGTSPDPTDITHSVVTSGKYYKQRTQSLPIFSLTDSRSANVSYTYLFNKYGGAKKLLARSIVVSYRELDLSSLGISDNDSSYLLPFFDAILDGTGTAFIPNIVTGVLGDSTTGAYISNSDNQDYFYIDGQPGKAYPIFSSLLGWSVPCPLGVNGC